MTNAVAVLTYSILSRHHSHKWVPDWVWLEGTLISTTHWGDDYCSVNLTPCQWTVTCLCFKKLLCEFTMILSIGGCVSFRAHSRQLSKYSKYPVPSGYLGGHLLMSPTPVLLGIDPKAELKWNACPWKQTLRSDSVMGQVELENKYCIGPLHCLHGLDNIWYT